MNFYSQPLNGFQRALAFDRAVWRRLQALDGLPSLLMRLYLAPIMIQAGWNKANHFSDTVSWFGNPDWGLGMPFPEVMAGCAIAAELIGGCLLIIGLLTRWIAIPLAITMIVAALTVHWQHGWLAIADSSSWLANQRIEESVDRLNRAKAILQEYGNYEWLTGRGSIVILNNGIEFAATYLIMLLALIRMGGGRYFSCDYWLLRYQQRSSRQVNNGS